MKLRILIVLAVVFSCDAIVASEDVTELDSYVLSERPFGFIGLKVVTAHLGFFGFMTKRGRIKSLEVDELYAGSPAVQAGIARKDKLTRIDGAPITTFTIDTLLKQYSRAEVGQRIVFEVLHEGEDQPRTIEIVVGKQKKPNQAPEPTAPSGRGSP